MNVLCSCHNKGPHSLLAKQRLEADAKIYLLSQLCLLFLDSGLYCIARLAYS